MPVTVIQPGRFAAAGGAPPAFVQYKLASSASAVTVDAGPTNGNTMFLLVGSPADTAGWTWPTGFTMRTSSSNSGWYLGVAEKLAGAGEGSTFTMGGTFSSSNSRIYYIEFTNIAAASPFDVNASNGGSSPVSLAVGPTATTAVANSVAVAASYHGGSVTSHTWDNGFTLVLSEDRSSLAYLILSATQAVSSTVAWTTARNSTASITVYKGV